MISNDDFALVSALDLGPIKTKLMHVKSGPAWSQERADAVETEYRRFLCLLKAFPNVEMAPLEDVDTFWHYHILDTMKYARDCEQVFGYFLHHSPYLGEEDEDGMALQEAAGARMRKLYESAFQVSYPPAAEGAAAWCVSPGVVKENGDKTAWCVVPGIGKASDANTAWCVSPGGARSAAVRAAAQPGTTSQAA
jgi:hypothetical protein